MSTHLHVNKRLSQIWLFYANIIGYIRLLLILISTFAVHAATSYDSFSWAIFAFICNYTGGWLLDWVVSKLLEDVVRQTCSISSIE